MSKELSCCGARQINFSLNENRLYDTMICVQQQGNVYIHVRLCKHKLTTQWEKKLENTNTRRQSVAKRACGELSKSVYMHD